MPVSQILLDNNIETSSSLFKVKQGNVNINTNQFNIQQGQLQEDTFTGKDVSKKKLNYSVIALTVATVLGIATEFLFAKGKHVKMLWSKLTREIKPKQNKEIHEIKPKITSEPIKTEIQETSKISDEIDESIKELEEIESKKELSNNANEMWLRQQHRVKEKEYSEFWNTELDRIGNLTKEARKKEAEKLWEIMEKERNEFFAANKNNIPSEEERYEAFLPLMRIEYGGSFRDNVFEAKQLAKEPENWLLYIWGKTPRGKELSLEYILKKMEPKELDLYNNAKWILDSKKLQYDELDLAKTIISDQRELIEEFATTGKFASYGEVIGHSKAYTINSPLRLGYNVDDTLKVILDEGFRTVEPIEDPVTVYRAVSGGKADGSIDFINNLIKAKKGETFIDKGYSYSSFSEKGACSCNGIADLGTDTVKLKIIVPKGARVSNGSHYDQNELLFPRNAEFRVVEEATRPEPYVFYNPDGKKVERRQPFEITLEYVCK